MSEFKGTKGVIKRTELELFKSNVSDYYNCSIYDEKEIIIAQFFGTKKEVVDANSLLFLKTPEMLEMLISFVEDFDKGLIEDYQIVRDRFEQLITEATELK